MTSADQEAVTRVAVNAAKALAAYVRQLRCGPGRFDAWLDGDDQALDEREQRGAALFAGRGRCIACHAGSRLTDDKFHNVGLSPAHTGQLRALEEVVAFHNRGGDPLGGYPGTNELSPLALTDVEQSDLVAFLRSLDGPGPDAGLLAP